MNRIIKRIGLLSTMLTATISVSAYDFEVDGIRYDIISSTDKTVMTTPGTNEESGNVVSGDLILPSTIEYLGETYTLTEIGRGSFQNNTALTSVAFPSTIKKVDDDAFWECTALVKVEAPDLKAWCQIEFEMPLQATGHGMSSNPLMYANHLFIDGKELTDLSIPLGITEIKDVTFAYLTNLKRVRMTNDVTAIGNRSFLECTSLEKVEFSANLTEIGIAAFYRTAIEEITLPQGLKNIDYGAFSETPITKIVIPDALETLGLMMFKDCKELQSVVIGNGLKIIPERTFEGCSALQTVTIGNSVEEIGKYAFQLCTALKEVEIPNSVKTMGDGAFIMCGNLETLKLPYSLAEIGKHAFDDCTSLRDVYSYAVVPGICAADNSFNPSSDCVLHVPRKTKKLYESATGWKNFANIVDDLPNDSYVDVESITLNLDSFQLEVGKSYQLTATILPEDATDKAVVWTSSDTDIAIVSEEGLVTGISKGSATITVACDGLTATCEAEITEPSGINDIVMGDTDTIKVFNLQGIEIKITELSSLPSGFYIVVCDGKSVKVMVP